MKCSRCGYKCRDIGAMGKHVRKHHPKAMKSGRKMSTKTSGHRSVSGTVYAILKKERLI